MRINAPITTRVSAPLPVREGVCTCVSEVLCPACLDYKQHEPPPPWRLRQQLGGLTGQLMRHQARLLVEEARLVAMACDARGWPCGRGEQQRQSACVLALQQAMARLATKMDALRTMIEAHADGQGLQAQEEP